MKISLKDDVEFVIFHYFITWGDRIVEFFFDILESLERSEIHGRIK